VNITAVRSNLKILICASVGIVLGASVGATVSETPAAQYQVIPQRNAFGLQPPVQIAPAAIPPPLPKITLTGITTILGNKRALMKVAPVGLKPGETNKEISLILTEGQSEAEVEVLQIDEKAGSVKVNNAGTQMLLTFDKDGAKLPATSLPLPVTASASGAVSSPQGVLPANPYRLSGRGFRDQTQSLPGASVPGAGVLSGATTGPVSGVPTFTGMTASPAPNQPVAQQDLTAEQQALMIELQRQASPNNPAASLLPPTPLAPK
jgi:hypothetical protein